ncbi:MAG: hypothetical protein OEW58_11405 [Gammaproteobacteria bacterium]|nr:hypothetical protein [Gammaproteobacteria bacterium]
MKFSKIMLFFLLAPYSTLSNASVNLPDLGGNPYPTTITYNGIVDALLDGNYDQALALTENFIYQRVRQELNNEKTIPILVSQIAKRLEIILNDNTKTKDDKSKEIIKIIENSISEYKTSPSGILNIEVGHSIEYGVTRLSWDKKIEVDTCEGGAAGWICGQTDDFTGECISWTLYTDYWKDYVRKEPDYYIYRIVNGTETFLTKLTGRSEIHRESLSFSPDVFKTVKSIYDYDSTFKFNIPDTQAFWYDFNSEYRNKGDNLHYKVISDNSAYKYGNCGSSEKYTSTVWADYDGDGKMDFIPNAEYQKYFAKYYGWLVPVITSLN